MMKDRLRVLVEKNSEKIVRRIEQLYTEQGYNQTTFGEKIGYSQGKISHTKTQRNKLSVDFILRAAKVLGVHPADLLLVDAEFDKDDVEILLRLHYLIKNKETDPMYVAVKKLLKE